jgi:hypothetical protein
MRAWNAVLQSPAKLNGSQPKQPDIIAAVR